MAASQCQVHGGRIGFGSRPTAPALSAAGFVRVEGAAGCCCSVFAGVVVVGGGGLGGAFVASSSSIVFFFATALAGWSGGGSDGGGGGGGGRRRQRLLRLRRRPGRERASECGGVSLLKRSPRSPPVCGVFMAKGEGRLNPQGEHRTCNMCFDESVTQSNNMPKLTFTIPMNRRLTRLRTAEPREVLGICTA